MSRKKKQKETVAKTNLSILPIRHYDAAHGCYVLQDESCFDIYRIISRDVSNLSDDELRREIYTLIKNFKTIGSDMKIISMNFPLNTNKQREFLLHHREKAGDEVRIKWIDREIEELELVDSNIHTSNFYLFCFGESMREFEKARENVEKYLCNGIDALCELMDSRQKKQILIKLCNMNSTYDIHYFDESEDVYE